MTDFATAKDLLVKLKEVLAGELGRFNTGDPAIWIEPPLLPEKMTVTGLQCIIQAVSSGAVYNSSANQRHSDRLWTVTLVNFDKKKSLLRAKALIESSFNTRSAVYLPPATYSFEQCRFEVFDSIMINKR